ncbi:MAG: IS30 family transposase, partial [Ruthenibacterium sp.]
KKKGEPATFTIVERLTGYYLTIRIQEKTTQGVADAIRQLSLEFGSQFSQVFRTITTDNGSEFAAFSEMEAYGAQVYFAHPYSAWERPINERSNRILRRFMPKGKSMSNYTDDQVLMFSDEINAMPRKRLRYRTPEELFEKHLDQIYKL